MTKQQTLIESFVVLVIVSIMVLIGNQAGFNNNMVEALPGMGILLLLCVAGVATNMFVFKKIPSVLFVITYGVIVTVPAFPLAETVNAYVAKVHFLALTTPILAYAGVAIGKDLDTFKKSGWRIVLVSLFVMVSTYIASAAIAQGVLKFMGDI
ncbi:hypothetical protein [Maridesulfovibrio hydrothermalis]|uniref:DUF340 domain-containing protein n=1 Tax=Maridesulfovibrio hydrothermalis AM13 = DSM 14728 TaxID=1121451 RepID=L0RFE1_9BACT|nr:hypothetical protein [Maridesulfovibrio hydrothermalis]CCO25459.1 conserved membrane protein of unknown function [Maridesulfovibrio hydrothermalis AM13 = DSM 14728]